MSEKPRCCFDAAKAISDGSGLGGSVVIPETLLGKGSEDHNKPPKAQPWAVDSARSSAQGLLHPLKLLLRKFCVHTGQIRVFCCPAFILTHLSPYLIIWMSL